MTFGTGLTAHKSIQPATVGTMHCLSLPTNPMHDAVRFDLPAVTTDGLSRDMVAISAFAAEYDLFIGMPHDGRNGFNSRQTNDVIPIHHEPAGGWHVTFVAATDHHRAVHIGH